MNPARAYKALYERALAYPGAWEDHPWDHVVIKVAKKIFLFVDNSGDGSGGLGLSLKLPHSAEAALTMFRWAEPTPYGLGKSGWISARFVRGEDVPAEMLLEWLDESYRAVAPKKLLKELDAVSAAGPGAAPRPRRRSAAAPRPQGRPRPR